MNKENLYVAYREAKANADKWKKEADSLGKLLKEQMINTPVVEEDGYVFERRVSVKNKLDEDNLVKWLEENNYKEAISYKPVLNEDKVSELLNNGDIDVAIIDKYTSKSEVVALYCKKAKAKKEVADE